MPLSQDSRTVGDHVASSCPPTWNNSRDSEVERCERSLFFMLHRKTPSWVDTSNGEHLDGSFQSVDKRVPKSVVRIEKRDPHSKDDLSSPH